MKVNKVLISNLIIAVIVASSIAALSNKGILKRIKFESSDFFFRIRPPLRVSPRIVVIEITDNDIAKIGRWPWKRTWYAAMTKALKQFGAKYIYFDIIFSEPASKEEDALFSEAIKEAGNVYLPFAFRQNSTKIKSALLPIPQFYSYIRNTGSINIRPDLDGVLRKIPLFFADKEGIKMHIALRLAMDYLNMNLKKITNNYIIIGNSTDTLKIPLVDGNKMIINWPGKWKHTFRHYSFLDTLSAYNDYLHNIKPHIDINSFKDSICIVAVTAIGLYDIKPIPLETQYPSIGATLATINNIIYRQFIKTVPPWFNLILIYIFALLPPVLISEERPLREILSIVPVLFIILLGYLFFIHNIKIDISLPLLSLFESYTVVGTYNFARISIERRNFLKLSVTDELTGLYNMRYFRTVVEAEHLIAKDDLDKSFCIIMGDIDHFKRFNDNYGHQIGDLVLNQIAKVLRISLRASDVVARYGGEEIIILLRGISLEKALIAAEKIRKNIENHLVRSRDNIYKITISLGVAVFRPDDADIDTIIKRADDALYKAKHLGRNRVETVENVIKEL